MYAQISRGYFKSKLTNEEIDNIFKNGLNKKGNCVLDSWIMFQKILKLKPKRVRGLMNNIECIVPDSEKKIKPISHYWVECNGMVYEDNFHHTIIIPINEYYDIYKITDIEYADEGVFYENNYDLNIGMDNIDKLEINIIPKCKDIIRFTNKI